MNRLLTTVRENDETPHAASCHLLVRRGFFCAHLSRGFTWGALPVQSAVCCLFGRHCCPKSPHQCEMPRKTSLLNEWVTTSTNSVACL